MKPPEEERDRRFRELAAGYGPAVRRLCAVYARNAADREDLLQNIFLAIWRAIPSFRGDSTDRTWLYSIAHNVAITWQAKERRSGRARYPLEDAQEPAGASINEKRVLLYELIARLAPVDREVVTLWLEGLTAAEIGEVAGVSAAAVAVRLTRIRQNFSQSLQITEERYG